MRWEVLQSERMYQCRMFSVRRHYSRSLSSGMAGDFYVIETRDWVNVVPLTADRRLVLVRQFRHSIANLSLEVPAGLIDESDASPQAAALRELREETGYAGDKIVPLGVVHPNPALMNNRCYMFAAYDVELVSAPQWDVTEELVVETVAVEEIGELIRGGAITNALTLVAFQLMAVRGAPGAGHLWPGPAPEG